MYFRFVPVAKAKYYQPGNRQRKNRRVVIEDTLAFLKGKEVKLVFNESNVKSALAQAKRWAYTGNIAAANTLLACIEPMISKMKGKEK